MKEATQIVKKLKNKGFTAYFAGGWVRDYLLNHPSDDIDIATNAPPETVESIFSHTIPIGKAFGIILVILNNKQYEVATFREDIEYKDGRRPTKIKFSSAKEDSKRRDFTINGMFYDPIKDEVLDYVEGKKDLENKLIKAIGNPNERFKEDRLRMIRAIRLSSRFNFDIEKNTQQAILDNAKDLFPSVAIERIWQEINKMKAYRGFKNSIITLFEYDLLQTIFPQLADLDITDIVDRLQRIDDFPHQTPVIIAILELFPNYSLDDKIKLCQYLKLSNKEIDFVILYDMTYKYINDNKITDHKWAKFYANGYSDLILQILSTHVKAEKRRAFLASHENKKNALKFFIQRIKNKDPIVKSEHLKLCGIKPSPRMGELLEEAEKISVNKKYKSVDKIIGELKKSSFWPSKPF